MYGITVGERFFPAINGVSMCLQSQHQVIMVSRKLVPFYEYRLSITRLVPYYDTMIPITVFSMTSDTQLAAYCRL